MKIDLQLADEGAVWCSQIDAKKAKNKNKYKNNKKCVEMRTKI